MSDKKEKAGTILGYLAYLFPNKAVTGVITVLAGLLGITVAPSPFPGLDKICPAVTESAEYVAIESELDSAKVLIADLESRPATVTECPATVSEAPTKDDIATVVQAADNIAYYCRSER